MIVFVWGTQTGQALDEHAGEGLPFAPQAGPPSRSQITNPQFPVTGAAQLGGARSAGGAEAHEGRRGLWPELAERDRNRDSDCCDYLRIHHGAGVRERSLTIFFHTLVKVRFSLLTIAAMLAIGMLTRYSGLDATMGLAFARSGHLYPFFGTLLGWMGVALTGSDTSSNVLFGSLQKITAQQVHVSGR